jgi:hypothetical protein
MTSERAAFWSLDTGVRGTIRFADGSRRSGAAFEGQSCSSAGMVLIRLSQEST